MLKGHEKAAAILSLLGDELSQKILSYLPEEAAISIISASERLSTPTKETLLGVVSEFNDYMVRVGDKEPEPAEVVPEGHPAAEPGSPLDIIYKAPPAQLAKALESERPEVSAYVLSHLPVEKIYETLTLLKESRQAIEERLISIRDVPIGKELEDKILKTVSEKIV